MIRLMENRGKMRVLSTPVAIVVASIKKKAQAPLLRPPRIPQKVSDDVGSRFEVTK
jgi:hypothetical protein